MRRETKARRAHRLAVEPIREAYRAENPMCEMYGCKNRAAHLHEITAGTRREHAIGEPALILALCAGCHTRAQAMRHAAQLWLKRESGSGYDLDVYRRVMNGSNPRQARVIEEEDIDAAGADFEVGS